MSIGDIYVNGWECSLKSLKKQSIPRLVQVMVFKNLALKSEDGHDVQICVHHDRGFRFEQIDK